MNIRYDDAASDFEKLELKFHLRNIFASNQVGKVREVEVTLEQPFREENVTVCSCSADKPAQRKWVVQVPGRRTGEFVCSRR